MVTAVIDMKRRNPTWGCPRIAQQITLAFGIPINKDVVRRISPLATSRHRIPPGHRGSRPSCAPQILHPVCREGARRLVNSSTESDQAQKSDQAHEQ